MQAEIHVAGLVVQVRPDALDGVRAALAAWPETQVHAADPAGKLVVTLEGRRADEMLARIGALRELPGVLDVALVYQHAEPEDTIEEEIDDEDDPP